MSEVVLYFLGVNIPVYPPKTSRPELYREHQDYGYALWPSRSMTYLYPRSNPRDLTVTSNSDGFRSSREFNETDERTRILVLGDSFVFGEGVEEKERFTNVMETLQPKWRVDSIGMTGYGPGLMLRALEKVGLKTNPDIVIFCMYTDDFRRVRPFYAGAGFEVPRFKLKSNSLETVLYPKPDFWDKLRLYQAISALYWKYSGALYTLNGAILSRFINLSSEYDYKPVIVFLPGQYDTENDIKRRTWLKEYATSKKVAFVDLTEPILGAGMKNVFIKNNWHYNPLGHRITAEEIKRFLSEKVLNN
jgi:hypothetical protein